jgi:hypothetical protein
MISYKNLAILLEGMEKGFRRSWPQRNPQGYPSHIRIREAHNVQFFALSSLTKNCDEALPLIVTVGSNYTQGDQKLPEQMAASHSIVEDDVTAFHDSVSKFVSLLGVDMDKWKNACLCCRRLDLSALGKPPRFHLVMTNLSPWITTDSWPDIASNDGRAITAQLLSTHRAKSSTGRFPFEHIRELQERLALERSLPTIWIGHGSNDVWEHFVILMSQMNLDNWGLAPNFARFRLLRPRFIDQAERFAANLAAVLGVDKNDISWETIE